MVLVGWGSRRGSCGANANGGVDKRMRNRTEISLARRGIEEECCVREMWHGKASREFSYDDLLFVLWCWFRTCYGGNARIGSGGDTKLVCDSGLSLLFISIHSEIARNVQQTRESRRETSRYLIYVLSQVIIVSNQRATELSPLNAVSNEMELFLPNNLFNDPRYCFQMRVPDCEVFW